VPLELLGPDTAARPELLGCFARYDQALEAGFGGAVPLDASVTPTTLRDQVLSTDAAIGSVLIGTEYDGSSYLGNSNSYFASTTCSGTVSWSVSYVGSTWNDRFQSGKGFGGCDTNRKFEHANFDGNVRTCTPNCGDYGALANEVSSLRWRP
jgi:hypothetical protein